MPNERKPRPEVVNVGWEPNRTSKERFRVNVVLADGQSATVMVDYSREEENGFASYAVTGADPELLTVELVRLLDRAIAKYSVDHDMPDAMWVNYIRGWERVRQRVAAMERRGLS